MTPEQATRLLLELIPLLGHLQVCVTELADNAVALRAPLAPNANHHGTAFGGSLSMLGIVAGWLLAYSGQGLSPATRNIVVADTHTRYLRPLVQDLEIRAHWSTEVAGRYRDTLQRGRSAAVDIHVNVASKQTTTEAESAVIQTNRYVAVPE